MIRYLIALCSFLVSVDCARAGVTEFENKQRPDFFAAVGGMSNVSTVDFTGFEDLTPVTDQWAHLGINFVGEVFTSGFDDFAHPNDGWGVFAEPDMLLLFDEPIQWIAADMPGSMNIELFNDGQLLYSSTRLGQGGTGNFGGLISDQPFDEARIFRESGFIVALDDLFFGPPIPVPGALAPLAMLCLVRRRRRIGSRCARMVH